MVLHLGGYLKQAASTAQTSKTMRFDVEVRTLDSYAFRDVRAIKVDVEGSEMAVLEGGRETILRDRPALIVELLTGAHADPVAVTQAICATLRLRGVAGHEGPCDGGGPAGDARSRQQHHLGVADPQPQRAVPAAAK